MTSFTIGSTGGDHLEVRVLNAARSITRQYDWVDVEVRIQVGGFKGAFAASFMVHDFVHLRSGLDRIYSDLTSSATFETTEDQLEFTITGDGRGHFVANGTARDVAGIGNKLEFSLSFDQSYIPDMLRDLDAINSQYPA